MTAKQDIARIRKKLKAIVPAIGQSIAASLEKSAQEIVDLAKHLCPVDDGTLRDSIGWTWGDAPEGSFVLASTGDKAALRITVYAGSDEAFYARWVEFGTKTSLPHGFMLPAYRTLRKRIKSRTNRAISKAIKGVMTNG
jgi:HK97 gp10 family phage protein